MLGLPIVWSATYENWRKTFWNKAATSWSGSDSALEIPCVCLLRLVSNRSSASMTRVSMAVRLETAGERAHGMHKALAREMVFIEKLDCKTMVDSKSTLAE